LMLSYPSHEECRTVEDILHRQTVQESQAMTERCGGLR
jgi:hypothetical protein